MRNLVCSLLTLPPFLGKQSKTNKKNNRYSAEQMFQLTCKIAVGLREGCFSLESLHIPSKSYIRLVSYSSKQLNNIKRLIVREKTVQDGNEVNQLT